MLNNDEALQLKAIIEALLLASGAPLTLDQIVKILSNEDSVYSKKEIAELLDDLNQDYSNSRRGLEVKEVASGWRLQVKDEFTPWVSKLWETRPQRYSRAVLEILSLIAYKQPITRAEIEEVRGVAVSSEIIKRLFDREWIKVIGHKEVPGRPALFATTEKFLDYFGLSSLSQLPTLPEFVGDADKDPTLPTIKQHELGEDEVENEDAEDLEKIEGLQEEDVEEVEIEIEDEEEGIDE